MKNWFEDFFNHPLVLEYFENRKIPDINWFLSYLELDQVKNLKVFDQCCGTGDVSYLFYQAGADVCGCDISENSLNILHQKYPFFTKHIKANAQEYAPPEKQDIVLNFFSSFGYYDNELDNEKLIIQCNQAIKEGGIFLFELMDFEWIAQHHKTKLIYKEMTRESFLQQGYMIQKWSFQEKPIGETKIKIYSQNDLKLLLNKYFNNITHYRDAGRQVFICRK